MNSNQRIKLYQKLAKLNKKIGLILEDVTVQQRDPQVKPLTKADITGKAQYDDKSGVVVNLQVVTEDIKNLKNKVLLEGAKLLKDTSNDVERNIAFEVDNVVIDITKVMNELKRVQDDSAMDAVKRLDEIRRIMQGYTALKLRTDKQLRELAQRRNDARIKNYESELTAQVEQLKVRLKEQHGITADIDPEQLEQKEEELTLLETEAITKIEFELKEHIRSTRQIIQELYDLPERVLDTAGLFLKAMGSVVRLTTSKPRKYIPEEVLTKLLEHEKFGKILEPFTKITPVRDSVNITKVRVTELSQWYTEASLKSDTKISEYEKDAKDEKPIKEGVFTDIVSSAIDKLTKRFKEFSKFLVDIFSATNKKTNKTLRSLEELNKEKTEELSKIDRLISDYYLSVKQNVEKEKLTYIQDLKKRNN
jgi:hypothetical protein